MSFIDKIKNYFKKNKLKQLPQTTVQDDYLLKIESINDIELIQKFEEQVYNYKSQEKRKVYDMVNVKNTKILERNVNEQKEIVVVEVLSKYLEYVVDEKQNKVISGDIEKRVQKRKE